MAWKGVAVVRRGRLPTWGDERGSGCLEGEDHHWMCPWIDQKARLCSLALRSL